MMNRSLTIFIFLVFATANSFAGTPSITGNTPAGGTIAGGTLLTITGTNFDTSGDAVSVDFGGTSVSAKVLSATALTCTSPAHAAGPVNLIVSNAGTSSTPATNAFTFFDPALAPTIVANGISPAYGETAGGDAIVINGTNFSTTGVVQVSFGGTTAAVTVNSSTKITATTPSHAAGIVNIVVTNPDTQSVTVQGFNFFSPPVISGVVTTTTGLAIGSTTNPLPLTVTGSGFLSILGNNPSVPTITFDFGGGKKFNATNVVVISSTTLTALTPASAGTPLPLGAANVSVQNPDSPDNQVSGTVPYTFEASAFTWKGGGGNPSWITTGNWQGGVVPPDDGVPDATISNVSASGGKKPINLDAPTGGSSPNTRNINSVNITFSGTFEIDAGITNANSQLAIESGLMDWSGPAQSNRLVTFNTPLLGNNGMTYKGPQPQNSINGVEFIASASNTYSGPTTLTNAILGIASTGGVPGRSSLTMSGSILDLRTGNNAIGSLTGTADSFITNSLPSGGVSTLVSGIDNTDTTFAGVLGQKFSAVGPINFVKIGAGTQRLTGANINSANVTNVTYIVSGGTLLLPGGATPASLPSIHTVQVEQNGVLAGNGIAPAVSTPASPVGGTISPGDPGDSKNPPVNSGIGTLTASSVDLSDGNLVLQVMDTTQNYDKLVIADATKTPAAPGPLTLNAKSQLTLDLQNLNATGTAVGAITFGQLKGTQTFSTINVINNPFGFIVSLNVTATGIDIVFSNPTAVAGFAVVPNGGLITNQQGGTATFTVALNTQPSANVVLNLSSSDTTNGGTITSPTPSSLTFTAANYNVPQTVTITGVNSGKLGNVGYNITGAISTSDSAYSASQFPSVSAINLGSGIVIDLLGQSQPLLTDELNVQKTKPQFTVNLKSTPTQQVLIPITTSNPGQGQTSPSLLIFPANVAPVAQTVTLSGVDDDTLALGDVSYTIRVGPAVSTDATYSNLIAPDIACLNIDDEATVSKIVNNATGLNSGSIAGGTAVTITGTNFIAGATVTVGGIAATSVNVVSSTKITAVTPAHSAGIVDVAVINPSVEAATLIGGYIYFDPALAPSVASISPASGSTNGGDVITITGSKFILGATVSFGGVPATSVTLVNSTTIVAITAAINFNNAGVVDVIVTNPDTQSNAPGNKLFTYVKAPAPVVATISPATGDSNGGYGLTVTGLNFVTGANKTTTLTIGGPAVANLNVTGPTTITLTAPAINFNKAPSSQSVVVTNPDGQQSNTDVQFAYTKAAPPVLTSLSPIFGSTSGGTTVNLIGSNFVTNATIQFGGITTNANVINSTSATAVTPAEPAGVVDVTFVNPDGQSSKLAASFSFLAPVIVSKITPVTGPTSGGTNVIISGSGFLSGATVTFGTSSAANVSVVSSSVITCTTPVSLPGVVDVTVAEPIGSTGTLKSAFTYTGPPPTPTVVSVTPTNGPTAGGTAVTIKGTNFFTGITVTFGGTAATVVMVNSTTINATTPPHAAGIVDIVVTNTNTQSATLAASFQFVDPPVINSPLALASNVSLFTNNPISFTISATDPQGLPLTITYNYGDGTSNTLGTHTYTTPGTYTITVTVSNGVVSSTSTLTITVKAAANLWVKKELIKVNSAGKESWLAQYIYNADRTSAKIFNPTTDVFMASLGSIPAINLPPASLTGTKPKFVFKSAKGATPALSITLDESAQIITIIATKETFPDKVPATLHQLVNLGSSGFGLDLAFDAKGNFTANSGYKTTAFVVAGARFTAKAAGKDSAMFSLLLADPSFQYPGGTGSKTVTVNITNSAGKVIINKDFTSIVTETNGLFKTGKDTKTPIGKFSYDSNRGKMQFAVKGATFTGLLSNSEEHIRVNVTIGDQTYSTGVTLFAPTAGSYSTVMPK